MAGLGMVACQEGGKGVSKTGSESAVTLADDRDSASFALGQNMAMQQLSRGLDSTTINYETFIAGMRSVLLKDSSIVMDQMTGTMVLQNYGKRLEEKAMQESESYKQENETFLVENGKKEGVVTLPSGLQYQILTEGNGEKPTASDKVKVHYHGTLIDGTTFDSSVDRGQPASFGVGQVIPGWTEALQLMPVGSKWKLFIPQNLAYGPQQAGPSIKPFSTLIFEVELLDIENQEGGEKADEHNHQH